VRAYRRSVVAWGDVQARVLVRARGVFESAHGFYARVMPRRQGGKAGGKGVKMRAYAV